MSEDSYQADDWPPEYKNDWEHTSQEEEAHGPLQDTLTILYESEEPIEDGEEPLYESKSIEGERPSWLRPSGDTHRTARPARRRRVEHPKD